MATMHLGLSPNGRSGFLTTLNQTRFIPRRLDYPYPIHRLLSQSSIRRNFQTLNNVPRYKKSIKQQYIPKSHVLLNSGFSMKVLQSLYYNSRHLSTTNIAQRANKTDSLQNTETPPDPSLPIDLEASLADSVPNISTDPELQNLLINTATSVHLPFIFGLTEALLETAHNSQLFGGNLAWWGVIIGSAWVLRSFTTLPMAVYQLRNQKRRQDLEPEVKKIIAQTKAQVSRQFRPTKFSSTPVHKVEAILNKRIRKQVTELHIKHTCHPVFDMILPIVQIPLWLTLSFTIRHMCGLQIPFVTYPQAPQVGDGTSAVASSSSTIALVPAPGMTTEGLLWFQDLSLSDPTWILPISVGALYGLNSFIVYKRSKTIERAAAAQSKGKGYELTKTFWQKTFQTLSFVLPVVMIPIAGYLPTALNLYWISSAGFSLVQNMLFGVPFIRRILGFVPLPKIK